MRERNALPRIIIDSRSRPYRTFVLPKTEVKRAQRLVAILGIVFTAGTADDDQITVELATGVVVDDAERREPSL